MYPPPPPMSRPVALVRSSEAATTSPPISTSPGEQHQLRYDLMPPILPPGEHGHAEGEFCDIIFYFRNTKRGAIQAAFQGEHSHDCFPLTMCPRVRDFFFGRSSSFMDQFFALYEAQSIALMNCYDGTTLPVAIIIVQHRLGPDSRLIPASIFLRLMPWKHFEKLKYFRILQM